MNKLKSLKIIAEGLDDNLVAWTDKWKIIDLRRKSLVLIEQIKAHPEVAEMEETSQFIDVCDEVIIAINTKIGA